MTQSDGPARRDVALWRGDDDPPVVWIFGDGSVPNLLDGSVFRLTVQWPADGLIRRSDVDGSGLVVDVAARSLTWTYAAADTAPIPRALPCRYVLQRIIDGRTRTWAWGVLTLRSGLLRD